MKRLRVSVALILTCIALQLIINTRAAVVFEGPRRTVSRYLNALKSLDHDAMTKYWADEVILRSENGSERKLNRDFMRSMRDFEREMKTQWSYKIKDVRGEQVIVELMEKNDFYDLLGVGKRTQIEVYYVRNDKIYLSATRSLTQERGDYKTNYGRFTTWLSGTAAAADNKIMQDGHLVFDRESAKSLRPWLKRWNNEQEGRNLL